MKAIKEFLDFIMLGVFISSVGVVGLALLTILVYFLVNLNWAENWFLIPISTIVSFLYLKYRRFF